MCTALSRRIFPCWVSNPQSQDSALDRVKAAFESAKFHLVSQSDLEKVSAADLKNILEGLKLEELSDPLDVIHQLAQVIPVQKLEEAFSEAEQDPIKALEKAQRMLSEAHYHLQKVDAKSSLRILAHISDTLDTLIRFIENMLFALGIADLFQPAESEFHAGMKFQKIMMLISLFTMFTATLLPMLGVTTGASVVGGTLLLIAVMSLVWPKVRPMSSTLPEGENWSKAIALGKLSVSDGRRGAVEEIARHLINKKHPLLIGPSGVGKTQTVQAFAMALERGDFPELKGKKVFYFNTANLVNSQDMFGGGNKIITRIIEAIGRHRDRCILVFDEIHLAFQSRESSVLGEQLKSLIGDDAPFFPYFIGLSTQTEYERDIATENTAGARRFEKITIENTDKDETLRTLQDLIIQRGFDGSISDEALEKIFELTQDHPQPLSAISLLKQCMAKTMATQKSSKETDLEKKRTQLDREGAQSATRRGANMLASLDKTIGSLSEDIERLRQEVLEDRERRAALFKARQKLLRITTRTFRAVTEVSVENKSAQSEFLLLAALLSPRLEMWIRRESQELGVTSVINTDLVETVHAQYLKNRGPVTTEKQDD